MRTFYLFLFLLNCLFAYDREIIENKQVIVNYNSFNSEYVIGRLQDELREKDLLIKKLKKENEKLTVVNNSAKKSDYYDKILKIDSFYAICENKKYFIQLPMKIETLHQIKINGETCILDKN